MTCAACAARIEKALNKLDGVEASVNFATEKAAVRYDDDRVALDDLVPAVEGAGYGASVTRAEGDAARASGFASPSLPALTVPVALIAMVPPLGFDGWEWVASRSPPRSGPGPAGRSTAPRSRAFATAARPWTRSSRSGTTAAYVWSVVALLALDDAEVYFEVASVITTLILLGRWLESRARRRSGAALRALLELGAKEARVLATASRSPSRSRRSRSATSSSSGPARRWPPTASSSRALRRRPVDADRRAVPVDVGAGRRGRRRDGEHLGPPDRPRDARRRRHRPRPDRQARRRGAGRQGADPAARRPRLRRLRARS